MRGQSWAETDPGLIRARNEDCVWSDDALGIYVVADGLGGHAAGDVASRLAVETIRDHAEALRALVDTADAQQTEEARRAAFDGLQGCVEAANSLVFGQSRDHEDQRGILSTLSMVILSQRAAYVAHVGDSRIYLARGDELQQLTVDHTLAEELIRVGRLEREDLPGFRFKNVVARALGEKATVQIDLLYVDLRHGDEVLLCSDGLTDFVAAAEILRTLRYHATAPAAALVQTANDHGGGDNISAIVVRLAETELEATTSINVVLPMALSEKIELLGGLSFCQHLSERDRMKVLRYIHEEVVPAGTAIVTEGETGADFFLLVAGSAVVTVRGIRVNELGAGEHFGEIALVSGQPRSATVTTTAETRLFRLSRDGFYDLSQKDQAISIKMLWSISQALAQRVTALSRRVARGGAASKDAS